jgi:hypothetical protein
MTAFDIENTENFQKSINAFQTQSEIPAQIGET